MRQAPASSLSAFVVRHRLPLLTALGIALYVPFLGLRGMWYPDEPDIAEVAQAMFLSGDWITPRRVGVPWVDYPPMLYWAGTVFSHILGGVSEFSLRLVNALASIALVAITCVTGSRWFGPRTGLWAGFCLLTFQHFAVQAVSFRPDVLFGLTITAGILVYAMGAGERPSWWLRVVGFVFLGMAMLAKGPLGLLLPGLVLFLWHGTRREWRRLFELAPLALIALAVYLPWFVACAKSMGADNILYELYAQNFARFASGSRGHGNPPYYYLVNILYRLYPWSPLLPFAIWWVARSPLRRDRNVQLLLWWFGAFLVFLSVAATKRALYIYPTYSVIALFLGLWIAALGRSNETQASPPGARTERVFSVAMAAWCAFFGVLLLVTVASTDRVAQLAELNVPEIEVAHALSLPLIVTGMTFLAGAVWIGLAWWRNRPRAALARIGGVHILVYLLVFAWVFPVADPAPSYRPQSEWIREQIGPDETHIGMVFPKDGYGKRGGFAYYSRALVDLMETPDEVETFFGERPGSVVLIHEGSIERVFPGDEAAWRARVIGEVRTGDYYFLAVRAP